MSADNFGLFVEAEVTNTVILRQIMVTTRCHESFVAGYEGMREGIDRATIGVDCDLIHSKIFVGDAGAAQSMTYLQQIGVTHVLNCAEGHGPGMVLSNNDAYAACGILYHGLPIVDSPEVDISQYFNQAVEVIDSCGENGKILLHCFRGRSRSACLVLAYLMIRCKMPAPMAMRFCCLKRAFNINDVFLVKLVDLHNSICAQAKGH